MPAIPLSVGMYLWMSGLLHQVISVIGDVVHLRCEKTGDLTQIKHVDIAVGIAEKKNNSRCLCRS